MMLKYFKCFVLCMYYASDTIACRMFVIKLLYNGILAHALNIIIVCLFDLSGTVLGFNILENSPLKGNCFFSITQVDML